MQRDVRRVSDHPAVVRHRGDMKQLAGPQLDGRPIVERDGGGTRYHETDMLDRAAGGSGLRSNVLGPAPAGLVGGSADRHAAKPDQIEAALGHGPGFIRGFEALEDDVDHNRTAKASATCLTSACSRSPNPLGTSESMSIWPRM